MRKKSYIYLRIEVPSGYLKALVYIRKKNKRTKAGEIGKETAAKYFLQLNISHNYVFDDHALLSKFVDVYGYYLLF